MDAQRILKKQNGTRPSSHRIARLLPTEPHKPFPQTAGAGRLKAYQVAWKFFPRYFTSAAKVAVDFAAFAARLKPAPFQDSLSVYLCVRGDTLWLPGHGNSSPDRDQA